ncbi:hypothetical protein BCR44DRAFT_90493 [Catenaria anguillulae PL171]|uniref:Uncharacterized protein n=1 Tax=Catenaria anguillulae PL171 TaxID=765915 RepID=A0A1Y2HMJ2_9FUNG|nr:hypothetical protein BCR44DRAFT_90493 [Catenaria anguillulae PL171]
MGPEVLVCWLLYGKPLVLGRIAVSLESLVSVDRTRSHERATIWCATSQWNWMLFEWQFVAVSCLIHSIEFSKEENIRSNTFRDLNAKTSSCLAQFLKFGECFIRIESHSMCSFWQSHSPDMNFASCVPVSEPNRGVGPDNLRLRLWPDAAERTKATGTSPRFRLDAQEYVPTHDPIYHKTAKPRTVLAMIMIHTLLNFSLAAIALAIAQALNVESAVPAHFIIALCSLHNSTACDPEKQRAYQKCAESASGSQPEVAVHVAICYDLTCNA